VIFSQSRCGSGWRRCCRRSGTGSRGRKPVEDRVAPAAIVLVLKTGITWNQLSADVILSSGVISTA
jgi:hypothetical protein